MPIHTLRTTTIDIRTHTVVGFGAGVDVNQVVISEFTVICILIYHSAWAYERHQ